MRKVAPCDRTRKELHDLLAGGVDDESNPLSELLRLAVRLTLEEGLEAKARDVLGRERYERQGDREGYRNGYRRDRVKSAEGVVDFAVPQLRDVPQDELTKLRRKLRGRTEELERLAVEIVRGCSTRDIEAIFSDEEGSWLSRTAVSEVADRLWSEYEEFASRDLSEVAPLYLFVCNLPDYSATHSPRRFSRQN